MLLRETKRKIQRIIKEQFMKRKHILRLLALAILLFIGWLPKIVNLYQIQCVNNSSDYTIINARINNYEVSTGDNYIANIQYNLDGKIYYDDVDYGIVDMDSDYIKIAVQTETKQIVRMELAVTYTDIAVTFAICCCFLIEYIRYGNEKSLLWKRKKGINKNGV